MTDWNGIAHDMAAQTEKQLLAFFGTIKNAQQLAHLYVIEQDPLVMESERGPGQDHFVRATQTWRIRLRTEDELRPQPNGPVHWVGDAPTSLHGNGAASFARTTRDAAEVTCTLCLTLMDRESNEPPP